MTNLLFAGEGSLPVQRRSVLGSDARARGGSLTSLGLATTISRRAAQNLHPFVPVKGGRGRENEVPSSKRTQPVGDRSIDREWRAGPAQPPLTARPPCK